MEAPTRPAKLADGEAKAIATRRRDVVAARIAALLPERPEGGVATIAAALDELGGDVDERAVTERVAGYLGSAESFLPPEQHGRAEALAQALVALGPGPTPAAVEAAMARVLIADAPLPEDCEESELHEEDEAAEAPDDADLCQAALATRRQRRELALDLAMSLSTPLDEAWRRAKADGRARSLVGKLKLVADERRLRRISDAMLDLEASDALVASARQPQGELRYVVTGTPVLYRGLAESVTKNQLQSLGLALALVLVIMVVLFRSLASGLLAAAPTVLTRLAIYGAMGAIGLHLDIGTSMLASIIIGAGVDYAVHLLAAYKARDGRPPEAAAAEEAGPAIWTNAIMVSAGFFVLTLGDAKPLQNVGGLTSAAMVVAALATFVAIPALARKLSYRG